MKKWKVNSLNHSEGRKAEAGSRNGLPFRAFPLDHAQAEPAGGVGEDRPRARRARSQAGGAVSAGLCPTAETRAAYVTVPEHFRR